MLSVASLYPTTWSQAISKVRCVSSCAQGERGKGPHCCYTSSKKAKQNKNSYGLKKTEICFCHTKGNTEQVSRPEQVLLAPGCIFKASFWFKRAAEAAALTFAFQAGRRRMLRAESVSLSNSALEAEWLELSHMTTPAAGKARIRHFYSIWQWTQLKIRALLLRRKENRCGSRQFALCIR